MSSQLNYRNWFLKSILAGMKILLIASKKSLEHLKKGVNLVQLHVEMLEPTIWFEQGGMKGWIVVVMTLKIGNGLECSTTKFGPF